ncbi:2-aminoethylphosphonate aminotransferase [Adlercreutzia sp. ZJ242]|uniref:2-aminoethylphosphonate aminotransferase n=1 Tax=Adlercreutzia sp. ZJ242 TaxID=2709409 RepID=UPI0013EAE31B|nr:2-aminoethylphosphonate--pyruvate transaminase [Adlercreutzia sp. ZJ242]
MSVRRNVLLNPGPSTTTDTVKMAQVVPDICPREKEFGEVMRAVSADLVRIVHGEDAGYAAVLFCGSGTVCIDAAISSLTPEGGTVLLANNGAYSKRAREVCEYYGLDFVDMDLPVDRPVDPTQVADALRRHPEASLVYTTHHETGTGVLNPIREIGAAAHAAGVPLVVDTTSSLAMIPIDVVADNVDACMASAQKGIQGMTGLSFVIARRSLIEASAGHPKRSYYCNLYRQYRYFEEHGQMHFTPPVQTVYAARQALREYFEEGEQAKYARHRALAGRIHAGLAELGLEEAIAPEHQSQLVVSVRYPDHPAWDFGKVHDYCYERGYTIYPGKIDGQDTFRLCTLGALVPEDIDGFMGVLSEALEALGVR